MTTNSSSASAASSAAPGQNPRASSSLMLHLTQPDGSVHQGTLQQESLILGSGPGAGLRLDDPHVSSLHLMLKVDRGAVIAIDLASERGTYLRDQRMTEPVILEPGDVLELGGSRLAVHVGNTEPRPVGVRREVLHEVPRPAPEVIAPPPQAEAPPPRARPAAAAPSAPSWTAPAPARGIPSGLPPPPARVRYAPTEVEARGNERRLPEPPASVNDASVVHMLNSAAPADAIPSAGHKALQVSLLWGTQIIDVQHFGDDVPIILDRNGGQGRFQVFAPGVGRSFELAQSHGLKTHIRVPKGGNIMLFSGKSQKTADRLRHEGRLVSAKKGVETIDLTGAERARIQIGDMTLALRYVRPSTHVHVHETSSEDKRFFGIIGGAAVLGLLFVLSAAFMPHSTATAADDTTQAKQMIRLLQAPEKPKKVVVKKTSDADKKSGAAEGEKAKDAEGKMGKEDAHKDFAEASKKGSPVVDPKQKEKDRQKVMRTGLLAAFGKSSAASDVLGPGGIGTGINKALGGLTAGAGQGDAKGVGGLGSRGSGTGGGGAGLGLGGLGTQGKGTGAGGYGSIDLGGKAKETVRVVPGKTTVVGGLSKDIIARVIKQHQSEIKYCYEVEMQKNPDLAGKVSVLFSIEPNGVVSDANVNETTLGNANTESCMTQKIKRWKFPEATAGGATTVTFPWVFKPAGAE